MISAKDELAHLAECVSEEEAEKILATIQDILPEIYEPVESVSQA